MNKKLIEKLLQKLTLKEIFEEVKNDDKAILLIADYIKVKNPHILIHLIKEFINNCISGKDENIQKVLKEAIINLDGEGGISINRTIKTKEALVDPTIKKPSFGFVSDPCVSTRGRKPTC